MFVIHTPKDFKSGSTIPVKINGEDATLTWRDPETLVIKGTDARQILQFTQDNELFTFICGDVAGEPDLPVHVFGGKF